MTTKTIKVDYLARVEGEGSLELQFKNGKVERASLNIFEPPRFFEALLRGRAAAEAPDITARICGICPVAYQMSACHAVEAAAKVKISGQIRALRRLLYCGEWISSHTLHIYLLHAPDFLGYPDAITLAKDHRAIVERGLELKKIGNDLMRLIGGREIHPINVRVGGFYRAPTVKELQDIKVPLERARELAIETVRWASTLPFPDFDADYEFVALKHPQEYPFNEGLIAAGASGEIDAHDFEDHFEEYQRADSTALYSKTQSGGAYLTGPMARLSHNFDRLPESVRSLAAEASYAPPFTNPFKSVIARALEVVYACEEALNIIRDYSVPESPYVDVNPKDATGVGATEAPRGLLYHRYKFGSDGRIEEAKIVPPTSQNQGVIEEDLVALATTMADSPDDELRHRCEQMIRNFDPCISCATHFLTLNVSRE